MPVTEFVVEIPAGTSKDIGFNERKRSVRIWNWNYNRVSLSQKTRRQEFAPSRLPRQTLRDPDGLLPKYQYNKLLHLRVTERLRLEHQDRLPKPKRERSTRQLRLK
jgi:hypothetical protein